MSEDLRRKARSEELYLYIVAWIIAFISPVIAESIYHGTGLSFHWRDVAEWWLGMIPFVLLFLVNNFVLIPRFLFSNNNRTYFILLFILLLTFWVFEFLSFRDIPPPPPSPSSIEHRRPGPIPHFMPAPVFTNILLSLMVVGINTITALFSKSNLAKEAFEESERRRQKAELKYLRAQINPHFFMNMLNNIHAMVEIDQNKAQEMILELSRLMRHILYEGEKTFTTFASEVNFLSAYISLMRRRYPHDKVDVSFSCPEDPSENHKLPPLIFVIFIENAFKHGISYVAPSKVDISIDTDGKNALFSCVNTVPSLCDDTAQDGGVGLENAKHRLDLLYGTDYTMENYVSDNEYKVLLKIPFL